MDAIASSVIFALTLVLVLFRPRGLPAALPAAVGGLVVLALRLVSFHQAWDVIRTAQDALVFLVGMMIVSAVVERAGFFDWCAMLAAGAGRGSVRRLYIFVFLTGTVITAFLSLDATAIVLTPIVYAMAVRLKLRPLPFMFACGFIANTSSLFMPISNLTNLLVYHALDLGFLRFSAIMFIPATVAVVSNTLLFSYLFRFDLKGRYLAIEERFQPQNRGFFTLAVVSLAAILASIFVASVVHVPIGVVALAGGILLVLLCWPRNWFTPGQAVDAVSWNLIVLVLGLFLVVQAVENAGLTQRLDSLARSGSAGQSFGQILAVAAGTAIGSNLINNIPMTVVVSTVLHSSTAATTSKQALGSAALIGTNIGPNLTITGSLATLIWLNIVQRRGMAITARQYLRLGIVTTPVIFLSAVIGLWLSLRLIG
jgi:arsenical pump membrane protein